MDSLPERIGHELEENFVKSTYQHIANEFSSTRYKKWPKVDTFLKSLPENSLLLDVGCGNGKYLDNPKTCNIGCDASLNLLRICRDRGFEVVQCDMMRLPFRESAFDSIICVAALHHIVSEARRRLCLEGMVNLMNCQGSKLLVQVWSFEQEIESDNPYLKKVNTKLTEDANASEEICLEESIKLPIHKNRTPFKHQDVLVPFTVKGKSVESTSNESVGLRHLRFYHVFKEHELDELAKTIPNITVENSYYDRGNWCTIICKRIL